MASPRQLWETQFCPILTAAIQPAAKPSPVVHVAGSAVVQREDDAFPAHPCAGPHCAFFERIGDSAGNIVGGRCCIPLLGMGMNNLGNALLAVLDKSAGVATPTEPPKPS